MSIGYIAYMRTENKKYSFIQKAKDYIIKNNDKYLGYTDMLKIKIQ